MNTKSKFYITTPIYYVNDRPHIGHAYTTILADVLARYHRLLDVPTFFLTGTDEHGQKVQQAAEKAKITPQEQADRTVVNFQELWKKLEITHDDFIRTTEDRHRVIVQEILQDLYDRGEIYEAEYDGWYDVSSETFVAEKDLPEDRNPEDLPNLIRLREKNYFFRMSAYQDWLIRYIEEHPEFIQPDFRRNETLGFLRKPLNDLCISRPKTRLAWGIELPFDADFVCYVWFDALVNYISAAGYRRDPERFQRWWPADYHLIGKDILTTHTVYWPTMLKAMNAPLPRTVFAHGWWLTGQVKMSKSLGNVVNPMDMIERYGVDPFRYFLIAEMTLGQDASFTEEAFIKRYNADLANDLGNLLSRVAKMIGSYCGGRLPAPGEDVLSRPDEKEVWALMQGAAGALTDAIDSMRLDRGLGEVMNGIRAVNRYLEKKQPWTLAKQGRKEELNNTLYTAMEALRIAAGLLYPVMPGKMSELRRRLGEQDDRPHMGRLTEWGVLAPGAEIQAGDPLFPRVDVKNKSEKNDDKPKAENVITYEEFSHVELKTAKIVNADPVEGADKLLRLDVMIGEERRQIVAGIALHYAPDDLIGKTVVVVANLKPAKIRGVESQGMLLAASRGERLRLVTVDGEISSGAPVK